MNIKTSWDEDDIQFSGYGSASTITEYSTPRKAKRRKFKVGFAIPKKVKEDPVSSRGLTDSRGVR